MYIITIITQNTFTQQLHVGCCHIVKYVSCLVQNYLIAITDVPNHLMDSFALLLTIDVITLWCRKAENSVLCLGNASSKRWKNIYHMPFSNENINNTCLYVYTVYPIQHSHYDSNLKFHFFTKKSTFLKSVMISLFIQFSNNLGWVHNLSFNHCAHSVIVLYLMLVAISVLFGLVWYLNYIPQGYFITTGAVV